MKFEDLKINNKILQALNEMKYETPTPIQQEAIPHILERKDLLGCAQTGTGKTAAFAIPLIQNISNEDMPEHRLIKVLVLTPTRELAIQIRDNFRLYGKYSNIKCSVIFGGVNQASQVEILKKGVDILVATPGRLLDLINQKYAKLNNVETLVLDEADTMLDMGFIHDVKKIITHIPNDRQTLMFSATMPKEINTLAETFLKNPVTVKVNTVSSTVDIIDQKIYFVDRHNKVNLLIDILEKENIKSALIFTRTKHGANKLSDSLSEKNISNGVIHGNKSQNARVQALNNFKTGVTKVLIATDIAARGIDINELSHVINFDMPEQAETYVHRIGRTGRAGLDGIAISLCDINEKSNLRDIENLIKQTIKEVIDHDYPMLKLDLTPKTQKNNKQFKSSNKNSNDVKKSYEKSYSNKPLKEKLEERSFNKDSKPKSNDDSNRRFSNNKKKDLSKPTRSNSTKEKADNHKTKKDNKLTHSDSKMSDFSNKKKSNFNHKSKQSSFSRNRKNKSYNKNRNHK